MDALDQMFQVLVRAVRARHPAMLSSSFTVGDIHQTILPYRHFRRELGLDTNQEYELILMELLTGARGYLDVDERLRDQLGKELSSASPDPSRVREFAEAQVAFNSAALASIPNGGAVKGAAGQGASAGGSTSAGAAAETPPAPGSTTPRCRYCGGDLPSGRSLHFCPHCGQNLQVRNCPACGAEVEEGWKFCVACGKSVS